MLYKFITNVQGVQLQNVTTLNWDFKIILIYIGFSTVIQSNTIQMVLQNDKH